MQDNSSIIPGATGGRFECAVNTRQHSFAAHLQRKQVLIRRKHLIDHRPYLGQ